MSEAMKPSLQSKIQGLLLGTAVADAIGLPTEGMKPEKIRNLGWACNLKHRFFFGKGMWSDDTEQSIMLTQALLHSQGDLERFTRSFAWELRWWMLGLPAATGLATARAIIKLWLGFPSTKSGVWSAGNGSAMRTAPIAAYFHYDREKQRSFAVAQTKITHSDPKAIWGTLAVTDLCHLFLHLDHPPTAEVIIETLRSVSEDPGWHEVVSTIEVAIVTQSTINELLDKLGAAPEQGVSGYIYQTLPAVVFAGIQNDWGYEKTITTLITSGGDTDTTAAIAGALCGALGGTAGIPDHWMSELSEWPVGKDKLIIMSGHLLQRTPFRIRPRWSPFLLLRNLFFLATVLTHGLIRLSPTFLRSSTKS